MKEIIQNIIYDFSYLNLYLLVFIYFILLYFGLATITLWICQYLEKKKLLNKITDKKASQRQIFFEIEKSIKSILVFGFSVLLVIYLIRNGSIQLLEDNVWNILVGLSILTIWNEIHFFLIHRIMHFPFFMKHIHYVHHKSKIPTVYSIYSLHWLEAFLLSTVPISIGLFIPLSALTLAIYPITNIAFNFAGHCNYRFGHGKNKTWPLFASHHNEHHTKGKQHFGFASSILDNINTYFFKAIK